MSEFLNQVLHNISQQIIAFFPKFLVSIIIFLAFYATGSILKKITIKLGSREDDYKQKIFVLIGSTIKTVIILTGLISALGTLGVNIAALVAGLGLTGFALGFALKDALSNLLAGILILFYQPFRYGDKIKVSGCGGIVADINLRYTTLEGDDVEYIIPNSVCFTNWVAVSKEAVGDQSTS